MIQLSKHLKVVELGDSSALVYTGKNGGTQQILFDSTGIAVDGLTLGDELGADLTPAVRTNNPTIGANTVNANISALDKAIGTDAQIVPVTRTVGQLAADSSVHQKIDLLDAAIGFDTQMSGTPTTVSKTATIYQNLEALSTFKTLRTVVSRIGGVGVASCDFNFVTADDQNEQVIDLGEIVPALARVVDVFIHTNAVFTGATTLVADVGTASGGAQLIASATVYATNAILATPAAGAFVLQPIATAQHIYVNATPGANWSNVTAGTMDVYVTFIDVTNVS